MLPMPEPKYYSCIPAWLIDCDPFSRSSNSCGKAVIPPNRRSRYPSKPANCSIPKANRTIAPQHLDRADCRGRSAEAWVGIGQIVRECEGCRIASATLKFHQGIRVDRRGGYTEMSPPKILFWGVMRTNWLPNHLNRGVRQKYFHLRSHFEVLGRISSV